MNNQLNRFFAMGVLALLAGCGPQPPASSQTAQAPKPKASNAAGKVSDQIEIITGDSMRFNRTLFEVLAGQTITLRLKNEGRLPLEVMGHNVVILKQDTNINAFTAEAAFSKETDYVPVIYEDWIIANTSILSGGETETITFQAPEEPGDYPFICTFPGHAVAGMKGIMRVVIEVEQ